MGISFSSHAHDRETVQAYASIARGWPPCFALPCGGVRVVRGQMVLKLLIWMANGGVETRGPDAPSLEQSRR